MVICAYGTTILILFQLRSCFRLVEERDNALSEAREKETKILSLNRELEEMEAQMTEMQKKLSSQGRELDELVSSKDDVGKNYHDLEKVN